MFFPKGFFLICIEIIFRCGWWCHWLSLQHKECDANSDLADIVFTISKMLGFHFCNWATPCPLFRVEIPLKVIPWSKTNIILTWQFDFHNLIVTSRSDFFPPSAKLLNFRKMFSNESCRGTALCEFFCHIYWKIIMWNSCFDFGKKWYLWNINCCLRLQLL